jgi:hypothetical protein
MPTLTPEERWALVTKPLPAIRYIRGCPWAGVTGVNRSVRSLLSQILDEFDLPTWAERPVIDDKEVTVRTTERRRDMRDDWKERKAA